MKTALLLLFIAALAALLWTDGARRGDWRAFEWPTILVWSFVAGPVAVVARVRGFTVLTLAFQIVAMIGLPGEPALAIAGSFLVTLALGWPKAGPRREPHRLRPMARPVHLADPWPVDPLALDRTSPEYWAAQGFLTPERARAIEAACRDKNDPFSRDKNVAAPCPWGSDNPVAWEQEWGSVNPVAWEQEWGSDIPVAWERPALPTCNPPLPNYHLFSAAAPPREPWETVDPHFCPLPVRRG